MCRMETIICTYLDCSVYVSVCAGALGPGRLYTDFFFFKDFIYLLFFFFLAVLGLRFYARAFSSCGKRGPLHRGARAFHCRGLSC